MFIKIEQKMENYINLSLSYFNLSNLANLFSLNTN